MVQLMEIRLRQRKKFHSDKKREFNPDLKPGEERVKQKGEPGTKQLQRQQLRTH